jgi:hypothetical protein
MKIRLIRQNITPLGAYKITISNYWLLAPFIRIAHFTPGRCPELLAFALSGLKKEIY